MTNSVALLLYAGLGVALAGPRGGTRVDLGEPLNRVFAYSSHSILETVIVGLNADETPRRCIYMVCVLCMSCRFRNEKLLRPSELVVYASQDQTHSLILKKARLDDAGLYTVKAANEAGELVAKATLTVKGNHLQSAYRPTLSFLS